MSQIKTELAFEKKLKEHLLGQDWVSASDLIEAHHIKKINVTIPHPIYGLITGLEAAIIYHNEGLFSAIKRRFPYGDGFDAENKQGFSHGYLAILHNVAFKSDVLQLEGAFDVKNKITQHNSCYHKLHIACMYGHLNVADFVLKQNPADIDSPFEDIHGRLPLEIAALHNHYDMCNLLLSYKPKSQTLANQCDLGNALHIAARFGFDKVVKVLIQEPAEHSLKSLIEESLQPDYLNGGIRPLGLAVIHLHYEAARELLQAGANVNKEQGVKLLTPIQLVLSVNCELREEFLAKDKLVREKLVLLLLSHGASTEPLTQDQLNYIEDIKQRHQDKVGEEAEIVPENVLEELPPMYRDDDHLLSLSPSKNTPPKKKTECQLCGKKFTSEINFQEHLKSKGHLKKIRKQKELGSTPASLEIKQAELRGLMEHLPLPLFTELLFDVFDRLEVIDLRSFGATCKSIRLIVGEYGGGWKRLVLWPSEKNYNRVADGESNVFDDVMGQLPDVKELIYAKNRTSKPKENVFYSSLFAIPRECRKLEVLDLQQKYTEQLPISFMNHLFENCPNLRVLKINSIWPFKPPKIRAVIAGDLDVVPPVTTTRTPLKKIPVISEWLVDFKINLPVVAHKLEHLSMTLLFKENNISEEQYADFYIGFFTHCPNLKSLNLYLGKENGHKAPQKLCKKVLIGTMEICTKLTELSLEGFFEFGGLNSEGYADLCKNFVRLEKLEMSGTRLSAGYYDVSVFLADYCTNLTALSIHHRDEYRDTRNGDHQYSRLTKLQHLNLRDFTMDDDMTFLQDIATSCTNITSLELNIEPLDERVIEIISRLGTKLQSLRIRQKNDWLEYEPLTACTNLTYLQLNGIPASLLDSFLVKFCKLQALSLKCSYDRTGWDTEYVLYMGDVLEICSHLTKLKISNAVFEKSSFNNPVVSTSLKVVDLGAALKFKSDLPLFYLAECCPNLTYLTLNKKFRVTPSIEHILTTRFPKLETLYLDDQPHLKMMFKQVNENRRLKLITEYEWK